MDRWKFSARMAAAVVISAVAAAAGAAQNAAQHEQQQPPAGTSMGYGVKLGGYFTDKEKKAAQRAFEHHFAKEKTCPKDMERKGRTCRALVQGHYWAVGQSLQPAVETFALPDEVVSALPPAPAGYEYVRAGEDILLMSKGIHLVMDVMENVAG